MTITFGSDQDSMTAAIRPLLKNEEERRSLEVRSIDMGRMLEVRLRGQVVVVRPNSLAYTREKNEWAVTAQGCLDRLRTRHSMEPATSYALDDVYREINLVLLGVFAEALSAGEYAGFLDRMNSADILDLTDDAARLKALNMAICDELVLAVGEKTQRPASAIPWTSDLLRKTT